ncbi:uncharacterized protein LOC131427910 [Malaya genurostris]|uniref:uncharacterized protein LOC131427910 n=1 Tax=Malaya genurostris TaxID=325434 RepID=UPI0026F3FE27|nr:uncharacterized protein LOC131427910 [Malaya genurostris]
MTRKCLLKTCSKVKRTEKIALYAFPSSRSDICINRINEERRKSWIKTLRLSEDFSWKNKYLCGLHFVSGQPAKATDPCSVDWVPSQLLPFTDLENSSEVSFDCEEEDDSKSEPFANCSESNDVVKAKGITKTDQHDHAKMIASCSEAETSTEVFIVSKDCGVQAGGLHSFFSVGCF